MITVDEMPLFKGRFEIWKKYKDSPITHATILEDFGLVIALHAATNTPDARLLAVDYAERAVEQLRNEKTSAIWHNIYLFAEGHITAQKLGVTRNILARALNPKARTALLATQEALIAAALMPVVDLPEAAEKAAIAIQRMAYAKTGSLAAGERAYNAERQHQKEMFKSFFN
jgi:hypothetical protein